MALEWPDFQQATITDAKTFDALKRAVAERCAAAAAGSGHCGHIADGWFDPTPDLERIRALRDAIRGLAPFFVRLEDERYRLFSWSRFPIAYTGADVMQGEHSLAVLPAPATPEADSARLGDYRTFLENCAWWLKQFRYVNVANHSYYTRKASARGSHNVTDSVNWGHEEDGSPGEEVLASPEIRELEGADAHMATGWMAECYHVAQWAGEDIHFTNGGWQYDYWTYEYERVEEEVYSGLVVRNASGLPGTLILVPGYTWSARSYRPSRNNENHIIDTLIPTSHHDDGDRMAGKCHYIDQDLEKFGDEWLETYLKDFHGEQTLRIISDTSSTIDRTGHTVFRTTKRSDDATRSLVTETEDGWNSWYNYTIQEWSEVYVHDFDGFGEWELGVQVPGETVPPYGQVEAIPKSDILPKPDVWDLKPYDLNPIRKHPRDQWRTVNYTALLKITPILDFNPSYLYQG